MASVYKRRRRKPIPEAAEIVESRGRRYAVWPSRGRRRRAELSEDDKAVLVEDRNYTVEWFDWQGKRHRRSGGPDKDAAEALGAKLEAEEMQRRRGLIDPRQERMAAEARRPLTEPLANYEAKMKAAGRDPKHVTTTISYIRAACESAGFATIRDISADGVTVYAAELRKRRSARTVQAHLTAVKGFTRWLAREGKLPADPLASVRRPNPKADRRRERRILLPEEWRWLQSITLAEGTERYGMANAERVLLYAMAVQTGLRSGELRSLTRGRLFLDAALPYVTCKAGSTKNSKDARQYVQRSLARELRVHIATKAPGARVFAMPRKEDVAAMLRADLADARQAWLKAARHDPEEQARREGSDFLVAVNHEGELLDFHALRHTCGAWLAMSGAHPKAVQAVMRHSTITLTMDTYGHLFPGQEAATLARLPDMLTDDPETLRATGTEDASARLRQQFGQQYIGGVWQAVAQRGELTGGSEAGQGPEDSEPQVFTVARNKKSRRAVAAAGRKAEGMGLEPTTGKPAPDFESGC
jgi:integrase